MVDVSEDETAKEVFRTIAKEEKEHLKMLAAFLDQQQQKEEEEE